jgi:hypothetical protein
VACDRYDEARYRERLGLAPTHKSFEAIAQTCVQDLRREMSAGAGKRVYTAYIGVIERYFIPFFGQRYLNTLTAKDISEFEVWRSQHMRRPPSASTLLTFTSAFNRIHRCFAYIFALKHWNRLGRQHKCLTEWTCSRTLDCDFTLRFNRFRKSP